MITVKVIQHNPLNDPSLYTVITNSFLSNKMQVNYNDDQSPILCAPLSVNCLKWSESFLGDTMLYGVSNEYTEPLRDIALSIDAPQVMIIDLNNATQYSCSPTYSSFSKGGSTLTSLDQCCGFGTEILKGKKKICMDNFLLSRSHSPLAIHTVLGADNARVQNTFHMVYGSTENGKRAKAWSLSDNNNNDGWEDVIYPLWVDSKDGLKT